MAADPDKPPPPDRGELIEGELIEASHPVPVDEPERNGAGGAAVDAVFDVADRVLAPAARFGWRTASGIGRRLGVNRTIKSAADRAFDRVLESDAAERAADRVLGSEAAEGVWTKVLESDEAQALVERVAEAPEVRSAITSQGVGLLEDIRQGVRAVARRLDTSVERVARKALRRRRRDSRPLEAGFVTRAAALLLDWGIVYGALLLISGAVAVIASVLGQDAGTVVIAFGSLVWLLAGAAYLSFFWSAAGRSPGMSFVGIRMVSVRGGPIRPGQALRRVIWLNISIVLFVFGLWGVLFDRQRRGWPDRRGRTLLLYADPELDAGLRGWTAPPATRRARRAAR